MLPIQALASKSNDKNAQKKKKLNRSNLFTLLDSVPTHFCRCFIPATSWTRFQPISKHLAARLHGFDDLVTVLEILFPERKI